ncbi:MAG: SAM-dependent chlorinase/fluorinase [Bacteroidetes bacterium]|nr:SAM-dependent chlorinase/fluorinase [Bacteroidota bacterium]
MPVITLTTDWGTKDYFTGAIKGDILSNCSNAIIVDITHQLNVFDLVSGAFIFRNSWHRFPEGTVHIIGVSSIQSGALEMIAFKHLNHFFLGANDGFFSMVFTETPKDIYYVLDAKGNRVVPESKALGESAAFLAKGGKVNDMGVKLTEFHQKTMLNPVIEENLIRGTIVYIDAFGNVVTNIKRELIDKMSANREYEITFRSKEYSIKQIDEYYFEAPRGHIMARYNESNDLELAINQGSASTLLGLKYGDTIRVEFK